MSLGRNQDAERVHSAPVFIEYGQVLAQVDA
jgi:hypothetical protein